MAKYKEYDTVLLKDGRVGAVVAVADKDLYSVDVGNDITTWENIFIKEDEIEKIVS